MFKFTFATAMLAMALASPSFGHAKLMSSTPAAGAEVSEAPKSLTFSFNEEVRLASLTLTHNGETVPVTLNKSAPAAKTVVVPVSGLGPGAYELHWTAMSADDGHVTKGSFVFTVLKAGVAR